MLVEPANDSMPFAESAAQMASFRCIENGFSMLRPTGKGVSGIIDREGRFLARRDGFTDNGGVMIAQLPGPRAAHDLQPYRGCVRLHWRRGVHRFGGGGAPFRKRRAIP